MVWIKGFEFWTRLHFVATVCSALCDCNDISYPFVSFSLIVEIFFHFENSCFVTNRCSNYGKKSEFYNWEKSWKSELDSRHRRWVAWSNTQDCLRTRCVLRVNYLLRVSFIYNVPYLLQNPGTIAVSSIGRLMSVRNIVECHVEDCVRQTYFVTQCRWTKVQKSSRRYFSDWICWKHWCDSVDWNPPIGNQIPAVMEEVTVSTDVDMVTNLMKF